MSNSLSEKKHGRLPAKVPRSFGTGRKNAGGHSGQAGPAGSRVPPVRRRSRWRWLALAVAVAVAGPLAWWAATRPSPPAAAPVPSTSSIPFPASADAYVSSARPAVNRGSSPVLRTASRPKIMSYLTFSVSGLSGTVTAATLRLWANVADLRGVAMHVAPGSWHEDSITVSNAPAVGEAVAFTGAVGAKTWVTADVISLVPGNGVISMALTQVGSGNGQYDSREGAHPPELVVQTTSGSRAPAPHSAAAVLRAAVEAVPDAPAHRYATQDDHGRSMDALKIISKPGGGYLGVYHSDPHGVFQVYVAESRDLLHWTAKALLDNDASQPAIAALSDSGYLLADEAHVNQGVKLRILRFRHYASLAALASGRADRMYEAPLTLAPGSAKAEGTPNIFSATLSPDLSHSRIVMGFHYRRPHGLDRPGTGVLTNFSAWSGRPDTALEAALRADGVSGAIGDRDAVSFLGAPLELVEAQAGTGSAWHVYLYDQRTHVATALHIRTHQGSRSFGNPTVTSLRGPSGATALVFTLFLPIPAPNGEAGELVYYHTYSAGKSAGNPP
jgi:hypothetical protein